jgi:hypothetical protein
MILIKAIICINSRAISRSFNAAIDYSGLKLIGHDLCRASLDSFSTENLLETGEKARGGRTIGIIVHKYYSNRHQISDQVSRTCRSNIFLADNWGNTNEKIPGNCNFYF